MKRERCDEDADSDASERRDATTKRIRHDTIQNSSDNRLTELLKSCLQKVCELQDELVNGSDDDDDAETLGFAACAVETFRFLATEGYNADHPVVRGLSQKLLRSRDQR